MLSKSIALAIGVALIAAGASSARPLAASDVTQANPIQQLVAKSRRESGLVIYGNPPAANFKALTDKFRAAYPWINITSYDLDNNVIFSKYASEAAQGSRTADLLISSAPNLWVYAKRQKMVVDSDPVDIKRFPSFIKQYKGVYVMSPDPAIIVYNKLLLQGRVPTSVAQLANQSSTYRSLTGYTVDNLFGYTALWGYVQKRGWANLQKIGKDRFKAQTGVSGQLQLLAQGGAVAAYLTSPTARFTIAASSQLSNILAWTYTKDATPLVPRGIGVTAKAASPASAKLFLNWIYTKAGQQAMCEAGFTAFRTGFKPSGGCANTLAAVEAAVGKKNVIFVPFSQKFVNDYPRFKARWHGIFG
jgi:iron(III) transport system substrate-binding protein